MIRSDSTLDHSLNAESYLNYGLVRGGNTPPASDGATPTFQSFGAVAALLELDVPSLGGVLGRLVDKDGRVGMEGQGHVSNLCCSSIQVNFGN